MDKLRKQCNRQEKLLIKTNKPNTSNKRQKNHLSSTPDSSLSIQTPNMPITDWPVEIPTPVSPEKSLSKIIWETLAPQTKKNILTLSQDKTCGLGAKFRKEIGVKISNHGAKYLTL